MEQQQTPETRNAQKIIMGTLSTLPLEPTQKIAVLTSCLAELTLTLTGYDLDKALEINKGVCKTLLMATVSAKKLFGNLLKKHQK